MNEYKARKQALKFQKIAEKKILIEIRKAVKIVENKKLSDVRRISAANFLLDLALNKQRKDLK